MILRKQVCYTGILAVAFLLDVPAFSQGDPLPEPPRPPQIQPPPPPPTGPNIFQTILQQQQIQNTIQNIQFPPYLQANPTITPLDQRSGLIPKSLKIPGGVPINLTTTTVKVPNIINSNLLAPGQPLPPITPTDTQVTTIPTETKTPAETKAVTETKTPATTQVTETPAPSTTKVQSPTPVTVQVKTVQVAQPVTVKVTDVKTEIKTTTTDTVVTNVPPPSTTTVQTTTVQTVDQKNVDVNNQPVMVGTVTAIPTPRKPAVVPKIEIISTEEVNRQNKIASDLDKLTKEMESIVFWSKSWEPLKNTHDTAIDARIDALEKQLKKLEADLGPKKLADPSKSLLAAKVELEGLKSRLADIRVKEIKVELDGMLDYLKTANENLGDNDWRKGLAGTLDAYVAKSKEMQEFLDKKTYSVSDYNAKTDAVEAMKKVNLEIANTRLALQKAGGDTRTTAQKVKDTADQALETIGRPIADGLTKFFNLFSW